MKKFALGGAVLIAALAIGFSGTSALINSRDNNQAAVTTEPYVKPISERELLQRMQEIDKAKAKQTPAQKAAEEKEIARKAAQKDAATPKIPTSDLAQNCAGCDKEKAAVAAAQTTLTQASQGYNMYLAQLETQAKKNKTQVNMKDLNLAYYDGLRKNASTALQTAIRALEACAAKQSKNCPAPKVPQIAPKGKRTDL